MQRLTVHKCVDVCRCYILFCPYEHFVRSSMCYFLSISCYFLTLPFLSLRFKFKHNSQQTTPVWVLCWREQGSARELTWCQHLTLSLNDASIFALVVYSSSCLIPGSNSLCNESFLEADTSDHVFYTDIYIWQFGWIHAITKIKTIFKLSVSWTSG